MQEFSSLNGYKVKDEKAREFMENVPFYPTRVIESDEHLKEIPSPCLALYENLGTPMIEGYDRTKQFGVLSFNAPYNAYQMGVIALGIPTMLMRKVDLDVHEATEWEFVNPPMENDVEYQTIQRFNGYPIYKKCVTLTYDTSWGNWHTGVAIPNNETIRIIDVVGFDSSGRNIKNEEFKVAVTGRNVGITSTFDDKKDLTVELTYIKM